MDRQNRQMDRQLDGWNRQIDGLTSAQIEKTDKLQIEDRQNGAQNGWTVLIRMKTLKAAFSKPP